MTELHYSIKQMSDYISKLEKDLNINLWQIENQYGTLAEYLNELKLLQMKQVEVFYALKVNVKMLSHLTATSVSSEIISNIQRRNIHLGDPIFYKMLVDLINEKCKEIKAVEDETLQIISELEKILVKIINHRIFDIESLKSKLDLLHQQLFYHVS